MTDVFDPDWGIKTKQSNLFSDKTISVNTKHGIGKDLDLVGSAIRFVQKESTAKRLDAGFSGVRTGIIFHYETRPIHQCFDPVHIFNSNQNATEAFNQSMVHIYYCVPAGGICSMLLPPRSKDDLERIYQLPRFYTLNNDFQDIADFSLRECLIEITDQETGQYGIFHSMLEADSTTIEGYKSKYWNQGGGATNAFAPGAQVQTVATTTPGASASAILGPDGTPARQQGVGAGANRGVGASGVLPPPIAVTGRETIKPLKRFHLRYNKSPKKQRWLKGDELQKLLTRGLVEDKDGFTQQFPEPCLPFSGILLSHPNLTRTFPVILTEDTMRRWIEFLNTWPGPGIYGLSNSLRQSGAKWSAHGYGLGIDIYRTSVGARGKRMDNRTDFPPPGNNDGHHNFVRRQIGYFQAAGWTDFGFDRWGVRHVDTRKNNTHMDAWNKANGGRGFAGRGLAWLYLHKSDLAALGQKKGSFNAISKCRAFAKKNNTINVLLKYVPPEFLTSSYNTMPDFRKYAQLPS